MAALIFETLWFHQAGLALGNSVWASSLVLAGFMGGLGFGNVLAARYGHRVRRPIFVYGVLEALIGLTGIAIVVLLPLVGPLLAPALRGGAAIATGVATARGIASPPWRARARTST